MSRDLKANPQLRCLLGLPTAHPEPPSDCDIPNITVLDISQTAIDVTKSRLGSAVDQVRWIVTDISKSAASAPRKRSGLENTRTRNRSKRNSSPNALNHQGETCF